jgi:hypothetical protein
LQLNRQTQTINRSKLARKLFAKKEIKLESITNKRRIASVASVEIEGAVPASLCQKKL